MPVPFDAAEFLRIPDRLKCVVPAEHDVVLKRQRFARSDGLVGGGNEGTDEHAAGGEHEAHE